MQVRSLLQAEDPTDAVAICATDTKYYSFIFIKANLYLKKYGVSPVDAR